MRLPRRFVWEAEDDSTLTHLDLIKGSLYPCSSVSDSLLIAWAEEGKLRFIEADGEDVPRDTVVKVHNASISMRDLVQVVRGGANG